MSDIQVSMEVNQCHSLMKTSTSYSVTWKADALKGEVGEHYNCPRSISCEYLHSIAIHVSIMGLPWGSLAVLDFTVNASPGPLVLQYRAYQIHIKTGSLIIA